MFYTNFILDIKLCIFKVERSSMGEKRNHSDVPPGDIDVWRQAQRGGTTTYHYDMKPVSNL